MEDEKKKGVGKSQVPAPSEGNQEKEGIIFYEEYIKLTIFVLLRSSCCVKLTVIFFSVRQVLVEAGPTTGRRIRRDNRC